jgi:CTP:molybdopterin cytidylyltransferase MocA
MLVRCAIATPPFTPEACWPDVFCLSRRTKDALNFPAVETSEARFGAIILAAGSSSRMGEPKQLLLWRGQPLVLRAVEAALGANVWPVVVVVGAHADQIRPVLAKLPVLIAENPAWAEGMASSLRTGISVLQQFSRSLDGAIVALCDQPEFTADVISRLIATQRATGRAIVASQYAGRNGAPALFLREHFAALAALTGEEGARVLLNRTTDAVATVELPELAVDLDTPADFAAQTEADRREPR